MGRIAKFVCDGCGSAETEIPDAGHYGSVPQPDGWAALEMTWGEKTLDDSTLAQLEGAEQAGAAPQAVAFMAQQMAVPVHVSAVLCPECLTTLRGPDGHKVWEQIEASRLEKIERPGLGCCDDPHTGVVPFKVVPVDTTDHGFPDPPEPTTP